MHKNEKRVIFALGAVGYPILELLYRRRTHWSMALAGGICFSMIYRIHQRRRPLLMRCASGALAVTGVEFVAGLLVNRLFKLRVWDYSARRHNILGQICPAYTGVWFGLCAILSPLCKRLRLYFSVKGAYNQKKGLRRSAEDASENTRLAG